MAHSEREGPVADEGERGTPTGIVFRRRRIDTAADWLDEDGVKLYTVSASGKPVCLNDYRPRLQAVKATKPVIWAETAAFAICHDGAGMQYLVLCWWGNGNELMSSVSVRSGTGWVVDPDRYSFCLWDLEILWAERNIFIRTMYSGIADLAAYRRERLAAREVPA